MGRKEGRKITSQDIKRFGKVGEQVQRGCGRQNDDPQRYPHLISGVCVCVCVCVYNGLCRFD
jgi:hypothetical protein